MNAYPIPLNGNKTFSVQLFDESNAPISAPSGSTFSVFSTVPQVATAVVNSDGTVTATAVANVTGITYIVWNVTTPDDDTWFGVFALHVTDQTITHKKYGQLTPA